MGQFGNNVKSAINLVLFKCIKGYTVTECKDLFFTQVAQAHYRNADVTLACERCYKRLFIYFGVPSENSANSPKTLQNGLRRGQTTKNTNKAIR